MDPQQELFTTLLVELRKRFDRVEDGRLPPEGTPYPFIYVGETIQDDLRTTKHSLWNTVTITIHVWSDNPHERGTMSSMIAEVCEVCRAQGYTWDLQSLSSRILADNSTATPLMHGVIDAVYRHY